MNIPETNITIKQTSFKEEMSNIKHIREQVFINEQHVPVELEWDEYDPDAIHLIVLDEKHVPIATSRMLSDGHIGRMAVIPEWRTQGIGTAMLLKLINIAKQHNLEAVFLSAQLEAIDFYKKQGFNVKSDTYMDAGIPHKDMGLNLT